MALMLKKAARLPRPGRGQRAPCKVKTAPTEHTLTLGYEFG